MAKAGLSEPEAGATDEAVLGRVLGAFGVVGWLRLAVDEDDDAETWFNLSLWRLRQIDGTMRVYRLQSWRWQGQTVLAKLDGINDKEAADALKGAQWVLPWQEMPKAAAGRYYWHDLLGCQVVNQAGEALGQVANLLATGANDVLEVTGTDDYRRLLPFVPQVVKRVDLVERLIVVDWGSDW